MGISDVMDCKWIHWFLSLFLVLNLFIVYLKPGKPFCNLNSDFDFVMERRIQRLESICANYTFSKNFPTLQMFTYILCLHSYKVCYCPSGKTGTSTWIKRLLYWKNYSTPEIIAKLDPLQLHEASKSFLLPSSTANFDKVENILEEYKFFTTVRHPFERIVSTYQDKVVTDAKYKNWRKRIAYNATLPYQAFPKFVEILYKKGFGYKYVPDHHITPFWIKCRLCYLNYSYIGKMETFQQDVKFIANKVGVPDEQIHLDLTEHQSSISTQDLTTELFSQLDPKLVENLYQYYFYDFKMFNYKIKDVIKNWKS